MKRGFLNTPKAFAKDKPREDNPKKSQEPEIDPRCPLVFDLAAQTRALRSGAEKKNVEVSLDGYKAPEIVIKERHAQSLNHGDDEWIASTLPQTNDNTDGSTECFITGRAKRAIFNTPGFPEPVPPPTNPSCFLVTESPGKGTGMFATRDIKWGDLIFAERALIIRPLAFPVCHDAIPAHFSHEQTQKAVGANVEKAIEVLIKRMPEESQAAYKDLWNCHTDDGSEPLLGISRTNGFRISDFYEPKKAGYPDKARYYNGTFKTISRVNHSCRPNSTAAWDSPTFSFQLRATRDIKKGEEICISYIDVLEPTSIRQYKLLSYDFQCTCQACLNPSVSDARLQKIKDLLQPKFMLFSPLDIPDPDDLMKKSTEPCVQAIELIREEGLEVIKGYGDMLGRLASGYSQFGYKAEGKKYQRMYDTFCRVRFGARNANSREEMEVDKMLRDGLVNDMLKDILAPTQTFKPTFLKK